MMVRLPVIIIVTSFLYLLQASASFNGTSTLCLEQERKTLLNFSSAFINVNGSRFIGSQWIPSIDCCRWKGVTCDQLTGHVTSIDFGQITTRITGNLPPKLNSSTLPKLSYIDLSQHSLKGIVPTWLFELPALATLDIFGNLFTGFGQTSTHLLISPLEFLYASDNMVQGPFPDIIFQLKSLRKLYLSWNYHLTGTIPFTKLLRSFRNLTDLDLSSNYLTLEFDDNNSADHQVSSSHSHQFKYLVLSSCNIKEFPSLLRHLQNLQVLYLSHNKIHGEIPQFIFELKSLEFLTLDWNHMAGVIPLTKLHNLQNLTRLDLSGNSFSFVDDNNNTTTTNASSLPQLHSLYLSSCNLDKFPNFLRDQRRLSHLDLSNNMIRGDMPQWLLDVSVNSLNFLNLSSNNLGEPPQIHSSQYFYPQFSGTIPTSICHLNQLDRLDLSHNRFTGNIPSCLPPNLTYLNLGYNQLHGFISPIIFKNCADLHFLYLNNNKLKGRIPRSLTKCTSLLVVDLGYNQLHDTFPHWMGILSHLQVLSLPSNNMFGSLLPYTQQKYWFPHLQLLDISNNSLNGRFSTGFFNLSKQITLEIRTILYPYSIPLESLQLVALYGSISAAMKGTIRSLDRRILLYTVLLDASSNQFQGRIPAAIGNLVTLTSLNLSHNNFTGHIPSSLGNLSQLESLDLSSNQLDGKIPDQLQDLTSLECFNVSNNNLVGRVPQTRQFSTFGDESYLGNPGLCGDYLTKKCGKAEAPISLPEDVESPNSMGWLEWKFVLFGFGTGMMVGLVGGYYLFLEWVPRWLLIRVAYFSKELFDRDNRRKSLMK